MNNGPVVYDERGISSTASLSVGTALRKRIVELSLARMFQIDIEEAMVALSIDERSLPPGSASLWIALRHAPPPQPISLDPESVGRARMIFGAALFYLDHRDYRVALRHSCRALGAIVRPGSIENASSASDSGGAVDFAELVRAYAAADASPPGSLLHRAREFLEEQPSYESSTALLAAFYTAVGSIDTAEQQALNAMAGMRWRFPHRPADISEAIALLVLRIQRTIYRILVELTGARRPWVARARRDRDRKDAVACGIDGPLERFYSDLANLLLDEGACDASFAAWSMADALLRTDPQGLG